jgi:hypothetical protein
MAHRKRGIDLSGPRARTCRVNCRERVELRVQLLDARQVCFDAGKRGPH